MWLKLLENWVKEENGEGLTIPFIAGALNKKFGKNTIDSVEDLFDFIFNSEEEAHICLNFCDESLGEYILTTKIKEKTHFTENQGKTSVTFTQSCEVLGKDYDEVIKKLSGLYDSKIKNYKYSKTVNGWGNYSESEKNFIDRNL